MDEASKINLGLHRVRSSKFILDEAPKINLGLQTQEFKIYFGRGAQDKSWTPNSGVQNLFWTRRPR
ncbi:hypothetical protein PN36_07160 [Candidatus Thiomargarita nelsonii]|uniref:Uncharacterized protein n=1 Tax=Candidatus Thiomargarita nelsonii TaxID=1003181 RepID=A0A4E0QR62_9GAMM|nr:hypothetical protein PN36_07160 [Candidatus Thiomargarita nelsonii]